MKKSLLLVLCVAIATSHIYPIPGGGIFQKIKETVKKILLTSTQEEIAENEFKQCINQFVDGNIKLDSEIDNKECFIVIDKSLEENGYGFNFVVPDINYEKNDKLFISGSHYLKSGGYLIINNAKVKGEVAGRNEIFKTKLMSLGAEESAVGELMMLIGLRNFAGAQFPLNYLLYTLIYYNP